jgi:hypothetical protein
MKRTLTRQEEFEILKLVLDKFLWMGVIIMAYGLYRMATLEQNFWFSLAILSGGAIIMLILIWILMKEYNYAKR